MNPYLFNTIVRVLRAARRSCPNCGHTQRIPVELKHEIVRCRNCGADIAPQTQR